MFVYLRSALALIPVLLEILRGVNQLIRDARGVQFRTAEELRADALTAEFENLRKAQTVKEMLEIQARITKLKSGGA